jgi:hypothetical protein
MPSRIQLSRPDFCTAKSYMDSLGYVGRAVEAESRIKTKGERQTYCAACQLARWPEEQTTCPHFVRSEALEKFYEEEAKKTR